MGISNERRTDFCIKFVIGFTGYRARRVEDNLVASVNAFDDVAFNLVNDMSRSKVIVRGTDSVKFIKFYFVIIVKLNYCGSKIVIRTF